MYLDTNCKTRVFIENSTFSFENFFDLDNKKSFLSKINISRYPLIVSLIDFKKFSCYTCSFP